MTGRVALGALSLAFAACDGNSVIGGGGGAGSTGSTTAASGSTGTGGPGAKATKVDILLGVDNSRSMADKQEVLALALSDLFSSLTNPPCLDGNGAPAATQPMSGLDVCPEGTTRAHAPVNDIHVGITSSSIGGHGSDSCPSIENVLCSGMPNNSNDDEGHLLSRQEACSGETVPTYQNQGFLAWDPTQHETPPGESDIQAFVTQFKTMVLGVGQIGCGYESQMEGWYRFLADPEPYQALTVQNGMATPSGTDSVLLQQRKDFLRPDSLLVILTLSDEDDCSTKEYGQFYYSNQQRNPANPGQSFHLPRARQECATNPNDPCCKSCGQAAPNCPADPTCAASPTLGDQEDDVNLRCWDQKRRFGIDFLYPVDRYVNALTAVTVPNRAGDLVPNPIFSDLSGGNGAVRDPSLVVFAGIVGVPWQDLAHDPGDLSKGYKSSAELSQAANGHTGWDVILGDPASYVPPTDPLMIESVSPRSGTNPATGSALAPPASPLGNPVNGNEYTNAHADDLQYACVFPIAAPRDCTDGSLVSCDCADPSNDSPLCAPDPSKGGQRTLQVRAKAYPGQRQIGLIKALGAQGVVTSICPAQTTDATKADYAYRPAIGALVERVNAHLQ